MREKRWLLLALYGILLVHAVSAALKTRPKFKIATTSTTTTSRTTEEENENSETTTVATSETNATTGHTLTGIPQIDYIWDPNLPRELNGYNLSDYPFYNSIPEDIDFKCDGLHDGFYASVPHKCQVYHHCLFGTRYDFLCANFTAFDQKTFICHFVSEVDCANSKKYWHRNDALYQVTTTTTTTTTTVAPVTVLTSRSRDRIPPRRRPPARRRPYDYYEEDYYDDEYSRPSRDFAGRDDYEYDERKYRRDRDREFRDRDRDRDFRDRERGREGSGRDDRDRDRYSGRGNRREPSRSRDPLEDDVRPRGRNPDQGIRSTSREVDDADVYDRRTEARNRDTDERRYSDKRFRDDYDDKEFAAPSASATADGLVKPAAPISSVYARPRAPPKIRRPVPLSEQDRYAYKTTPAQPTEEPRRRPADLVEDDYYDDELEDVRPIRRPIRRRPSYRERDRDFYDTRDRDRPLRNRYHSSPEEVRLRTHQDRSRDRYYDRERDRGSRDRALDRGKDRERGRSQDAERPSDRDRGRSQDPERSLDRGRSQDSDRQERPYSSRVLDRDRDAERSRTSSRAKDSSDSTEASRRPSSYDRTTEKTSTTTTTTTCLPEQLVHKSEADSREAVTDRTEKPSYPERPTRPTQAQSGRVVAADGQDYQRNLSEKPQRTSQQTDYQDRDLDGRNEQPQYQVPSDEYSSEYYDEPLEEPPPSPPPPRTTVRIVKRPFLPSRGGNPNPRGLSSVGSKAPQSPRRDEEVTTGTLEEDKVYYVQEEIQEDIRDTDQEARVKTQESNKQTYDAYKAIQSDLQKKQRQDEYDTAISRPALRRPIEKNNEEEEQVEEEEEEVSRGPENLSNSSRGSSTQNQSYDSRHQTENLEPKWIENYSSEKHANAANVQTRGKARIPSTETPNIYSSTYKSEDIQDLPSGPGSYRVKQRINEVTHRLQDIPESEYDVTLNDALTPTLIQEANLPSGFVLPLHRQPSTRDAVLQPSENNYKLTRPVNQQQQKPFLPSPQFLPTSVNNNDRGRTVYYRTPENVQISGTQYRQQRTWQDYPAY
ncbi:PREDICTED: zinc finger CCCH domain-containing protein 13 [Dinoponera quadriceps]|uniref:Zinc finger CCCH domain-containing protein 13 n=1 Tax=Dinoponera quadriceps TaxID=609295 RepID=A0A6P3Y1B2_DINQU|nr:PREDICTED: zinc finger CCCH domain-containing protein 13 [Dinoponera quadriceps]